MKITRFLYFVPALLFYMLIFFVSSQSLPFSLPGHWLDKAPHALVFVVMGYLLSLGFFHVVPTSARASAVLAFLTGTGLGVLDEVHQRFTQGRISDPVDAAADAAGVAIGIAVYWYFLVRDKRVRSSP